MQRALDSPPPPRRRPQRRPVESDYEESQKPEPPTAAVDRGLRSAARAGGEGRLGATSQDGGRSTAYARGNDSPVVTGLAPPPSFEAPVVPDRHHQFAERVDGVAGQDQEWPDHSWHWNWSRSSASWWTWTDGYDHTRAWTWQAWDWDHADGQNSSDRSWQRVEVASTGPASGTACEKGGHQVSLEAVDRVEEWWQSDGRAYESVEVNNCSDGAWDHFRLNASEDEKPSTSSPVADKEVKKSQRIPSSYPSSFAAQPTESYQEWKRAAQMWIAGEGGLLPYEVIGPRVLSVLKGRASILTRKLSVAQVSGKDGLDIIFRTLENSSLVQELSGQRGERAQREFLQCRRVAHESLDSFLMRVEAQRDLMLEEDAEFCMGERFLVGYVLDNAELTQRDRVLVMAAAGNKLSTEAIYPALRRMGPFLQGTVPIGRGLSERPLLPELQPDVSASTSSAASGHTATRGRFNRTYGAHVLEEEDGLGASPPADDEDGGGPNSPEDELDAVEHDTLVAVQQGQARLRAIRQARGYYKKTEQNAHGDSAAKQRLQKLMAENPCRGCGGYGHWSRDPECPRNQSKPTSSANVASAPTDTASVPEQPPSVGLATKATPTHAAMSAVLESFVERPKRQGPGPATSDRAALSTVLESLLDGPSKSSAHGAYMTAVCEGGLDITPSDTHHIPFGLDTLIAQPRIGDYEGVMIVDIGCVRSVAGRAWVEREVAIRKQLNKYVKVERTADWFRFGDGVRRLSRYRVHLEVAIKGHVGLLAVNMIDFPCPPLLSKAVCNGLGMCIDCEANLCEIRRLGERKCTLLVSGEGHYLLRINDFFPRNPSWQTLLEGGRKPKIDSEDIRMFEIRCGQAVGKGSKSRLRRQALVASAQVPGSCIDHGTLEPPPPDSEPRAFLESRSSREHPDSLGGGLGGQPAAVADPCGCAGLGRRGLGGGGGCIHDLNPEEGRCQTQAKGQGSSWLPDRRQADQVHFQDPLQGRSASGHDRGASPISTDRHDKIVGSVHECQLGLPSTNGHSQMEGTGPAAPLPRGHGSPRHALEEASSMVVGPVRDRASSRVGPCRIVRQDHPRSEGSTHVSLKQAFQRGHMQRLKKGISYALECQAALQAISSSEQPERQFCLIEVFGTSVSVHAAQGSAWIAYEPVDLLCGSDLHQKAEQDLVLKQLESLDPDLVIVTPPCGPWSSLQAINDPEVVAWKRLMAFHLWNFTRRVWDSQTARGKLCMTEQPWLSKALELRVMATRPHLHRALIDQCAFGLADPNNGKPMRKRTALDCNSAVFAFYLEQGAQCMHARSDHQVVEGGTLVEGKWVNRSLIAGLWPQPLCAHILQAAEAALEYHDTSMPARNTWFVQEGDLDWSALVNELGHVMCTSCSACRPVTGHCSHCLISLCEQCFTHHAKGCDLVGDGHMVDNDQVDGHLSCVAESEAPSQHVIGDPEVLSEVAIRQEFKRLQQQEDERKGDFGGIGSRYGYVRFVGPSIRLPKEVRNQLSKLHGQFSHPSNERLARMLQINGAHKAIIEGAKNLRCSICERISAPRSSPQASAKAPNRFNEQCALDSFFVLDSAGSRWNVTHIIDGFCTLQYGIVSKNPNSASSTELLFERWILTHGPMDMVLVDGGSEFRGSFETMCKLYDIRLSVLPTSAKYKAGLVERHGAVLKLMVLRVIHELSITKEQELRLAVAMCCQAKNRLLRKCGKSPLQVVQGRDVTVPSSLMQQVADGEVRMATNHCITHDDELNRIEQMRCAAISAFHWLDSHERLRVALSARSRPPRLVSLTPGTQVYFHKPPGQHRRLQDNATGQLGPAVVAATEGADKVWLRFKGSVVRVALENVRLATPEETLDSQYITDVLKDMQQELTGESRPSGYEDITEEVEVSRSQHHDPLPMVSQESQVLEPTSTPVDPIAGPESNNRDPSMQQGRPVGDTAHTGPLPQAEGLDVTNPPPVVPSLSIPEADQTPAVQEQIERSRLAADKLDGHVMKKSRVGSTKEPEHNPLSQAAASSEPISRPSETHDVPDSLTHAPVRQKVEFFEGGAQLQDWDALAKKLNVSFDAISELERARYESVLRQAADLLPEGLERLRKEKRREETMPSPEVELRKLSKRDFGSSAPDRADRGFETFENGVVTWAPSWALAVWSLEAAVCSLPKDEEGRLQADQQARQNRFELLEQGFDEETRTHELSLCLLERGHNNGPSPGARNEIYCKDMTAAELRLTIPALVKALAIHFDHEAIRPVKLGVVVPKDRIIHSRMVIVNQKQLTQGFEPKGRLCVGGHRDPDLGRYEAASPTALAIAHALLLCIATTLGWRINIADVTAAFLQGLALPRAEPLYIRVPSGCPQEVLDYLKWRLGSENRGDIFEATKGIFGLSESPRLWYLRFRETLA